jgi:hypothetical protein
MATRKSAPSAEKKTTTRKAPAGKTVQAAAPAAENSAQSFVARRTPTYEEITRLAEQFWIERGRPFGSPEVDWLRAEQTLYVA